MICKYCGRDKAGKHSKRVRTVKTLSGPVEETVIVLRCRDCGRASSLYPPGSAGPPGCHYGWDVMQAALGMMEEGQTLASIEMKLGVPCSTLLDWRVRDDA